MTLSYRWFRKPYEPLTQLIVLFLVSSLNLLLFVFNTMGIRFISEIFELATWVIAGNIVWKSAWQWVVHSFGTKSDLPRKYIGVYSNIFIACLLFWIIGTVYHICAQSFIASAIETTYNYDD